METRRSFPRGHTFNRDGAHDLALPTSEDREKPLCIST
jgi:hypothetical protein